MAQINQSDPRSTFREAAAYAYSKENKIRNSKEYITFLQQQIAWLKQLNAIDSNPNDGRVDISVFNAKVAVFGWKAVETTKYIQPTVAGGIGHVIDLKSVDINQQAYSMANQKFGLK